MHPHNQSSLPLTWIPFLFLSLLLHSCYICYYLVIYNVEVPHQKTLTYLIYHNDLQFLLFFWKLHTLILLYGWIQLEYVYVHIFKITFLLMDIYIVTNGGMGMRRYRGTVKERTATSTKECSKMPVAMCFRNCVLCGVCEWWWCVHVCCVACEWMYDVCTHVYEGVCIKYSYNYGGQKEMSDIFLHINLLRQGLSLVLWLSS